MPRVASCLQQPAGDELADATSGATTRWSQSNLSLFNYYSARECVHCPHHSDVGLVTVIPTAQGAGGLHVYDWRRECWFEVETDAPAGLAVVFGGESLGVLTQFIPTMHDVSHLTGSRSSMAFQLLAEQVCAGCLPLYAPCCRLLCCLPCSSHSCCGLPCSSDLQLRYSDGESTAQNGFV